MKCQYHRLVKGNQHLVVDGKAGRQTVRMIARQQLGVGTTVIYANQIQCNDCGQCL